MRVQIIRTRPRANFASLTRQVARRILRIFYFLCDSPFLLVALFLVVPVQALSVRADNQQDGASENAHVLSVIASSLCASLAAGMQPSSEGMHAATIVAIRCICGHSFGKYLTFTGHMEIEDVHEGMQLAFGAELEIFRWKHSDKRMTSEPLSRDNYDALLRRGRDKYERRDEHGFNHWLSSHTSFPIWRYGFRVEGVLVTMVCGLLGLIPLTVISVTRAAIEQPISTELCYAVAFTIVTIYCGKLLDVKREVSYIEVRETDVTDGQLWRFQFDNAIPEPVLSSDEAVDDLKFGRVRRPATARLLLVPVMSVRLAVPHYIAQWLFIISPFRGFLLLWGIYCGAGMSLPWAVAYGLTATLQARVQKEFASRFVRDTQLTNIIWFRRLENHTYYAEVPASRRVLG